MPDTPTLSVVVGTFNRIDQIKRCIDSIVRETQSPYVIYVTDAGSTDGTVEYLNEIASDRIRPVLEGRRVGQAQAYNAVFDRIETPYVCWLSDDNEVVDHGLDRALEIARSDPRIGLIALKTRDVIGPFSDHPYIGGVSWLGILNVNQGLLPTPVLRQVGGFCPAFRDYGIDPDLTAKVLLSGYDVVYTRSVALLHYRNWPEDNSSAEYKSLMEKHKKFRNLYIQKYGFLNRWSPYWTVRRAAWLAVSQLLSSKRMAINSQEPVFGCIPRDWQNMIRARFVNPFTELLRPDHRYHLRQRMPKRLRRSPSPPPLSQYDKFRAAQ
jgi:GT2 family glycosyltransferase